MIEDTNVQSNHPASEQRRHRRRYGFAFVSLLLILALQNANPASARGTGGPPDCPDVVDVVDRTRLPGIDDLTGAAATSGDPADPCADGPTVAVDDSTSVDLGDPVTLDVTANDTASVAVDTAVMTSGQLPPGTSMAAGGLVTGTPTTCGTFTGTYLLTSTSTSNDTAQVRIDVICGGSTPTVANDDTVSGALGDLLSIDVTANDAPSVAVDRIAYVSGSVPDGMALATNGSLSGRPTECGTFAVTYRLFSTSSSTDTAVATVNVSCVSGTPTIAVDDEIRGRVGTYLTSDVTPNDSPSLVVAGVDIVSGDVAPGMTVWPTGEVTGTPTTVGTFVSTYRLRSTSGSTDTATITMIIDTGSIPPIPPPWNCEAEIGTAGIAGVEVHVRPGEDFAPSYNFYDSGERLLFNTSDLIEALDQREELDDRREREWESGSNPGFDSSQVFFVSSVSGGDESSLLRCDRVERSPIGLDVDGSGSVERIEGSFLFDIDADGTDDVLGEWFAPTEGILIVPSLSAGRGGRLTGANLFGDLGGRYADGFVNLARRDTDRDGRVAGDELSGMAVWVDADSDARLDAGELSSLDDHGIVSLSTSHDEFVSSAGLADGTEMATEDLWFPLLKTAPADIRP